VSETRDQIRQIVANYFAESLDGRALPPDDVELSESGINPDSLGRMGLLVELEEQLDVQFDDENLTSSHVRSIDSLYHLVSSAKAAENREKGTK
jgi:acyl carrier protein